MPTEQEHQIQLGLIERYYDTAQKYYELVWNNGDTGPGLHYGIWAEGETNRAGAIERENELLANLVNVKPGDLVLDAGCGVGSSSIWLSKNRGAKVEELNITHSQLKIAGRLARDHGVSSELHPVQADYHYLSYRSGTFDVFWSLESIEHSDNVPLFIQEAFRTLKPGGRAVIAGTFKGHREPTGEQMRQLEIGKRAAGAFNDLRTAEEVAQLMTDAGFQSVHTMNATHLVMPSARQMHVMCTLGLPGAILGNKMRVIPQNMVDNTAWGTYQKGLFESDVTSYNFILAQRQ